MPHVDAPNATDNHPHLPKKKSTKRSAYFSDAELKANRAGKLTAEQKQRLQRIYLCGAIRLLPAAGLSIGLCIIFLYMIGSATVGQTFADESLSIIGSWLFLGGLLLPLAIGAGWVSMSIVQHIHLLRQLSQNELPIQSVTGRIALSSTYLVVGTQYIPLQMPVERSVIRWLCGISRREGLHDYLASINGDQHVYFVASVPLLLSLESAFDGLSEEESLARFYRQKQAHINDVLDITEVDLIVNRAGKLADSQREVMQTSKSGGYFVTGWLLCVVIGGIFYATNADLDSMGWLAFLREDPFIAVGLLSVPGIILLGISIWSWWVLHEHHVDAQRGVVFAYRGQPTHMRSHEINVGKSGRISVDSKAVQAAFIADLEYVIYILPRTRTLIGAEVIPPRELSDNGLQ